VSHHLQVIAGTVTQALDWNAQHHRGWGSYRLILDLDDLLPGVPCVLVGTWAQRLNPDTLHARLAELGIQPAADQVPA
jgi:hypothetical protein